MNAQIIVRLLFLKTKLCTFHLYFANVKQSRNIFSFRQLQMYILKLTLSETNHKVHLQNISHKLNSFDPSKKYNKKILIFIVRYLYPTSIYKLLQTFFSYRQSKPGKSSLWDYAQKLQISTRCDRILFHTLLYHAAPEH